MPDEVVSDASSANQRAGFALGQSVPISVIETEVKMIRNHLRQSLQTVGTYNGSYKEIQCDGATLAAIAAVAIEHPASLSWKD